jgi:hypothetical protein
MHSVPEALLASCCWVGTPATELDAGGISGDNTWQRQGDHVTALWSSRFQSTLLTQALQSLTANTARICGAQAR